jgi:hypothetical protein
MKDLIGKMKDLIGNWVCLVCKGSVFCRNNDGRA